MMRRRLAILVGCVLAGLAVFCALTCVRPPAGHFDFNLRMNELACLRQGVNPYAVWHGDVVLPPYRSNMPHGPVPAGCTEQVNAYAPWAYAYMLPLSYLPRSLAWTAYCLLMGLALAATFLFVYFDRNRPDARTTDCASRFLAAALPLVVVSYLVWSNLSVGNFIVFTLAGAAGMAWCLARGRDALAGCCWALAMVKPQVAVLLAVPLLLRRRWVTCGTAGGICLAASLVPQTMCGESLVNLLRQGPAANAELFRGCGTYPSFLCGMLPNGIEIGVGLVIGLLLCLVLTWRLRREHDWFVFLMPAAVCAGCWTYTQVYSHAICWFLALAVVRDVLAHPRAKAMWVLLAACLLALPRVVLAAYGFCAYFGRAFPLNESSFRSLDSLNSTLTLVLAALFVFLHEGMTARRAG